VATVKKKTEAAKSGDADEKPKRKAAASPKPAAKPKPAAASKKSAPDAEATPKAAKTKPTPDEEPAPKVAKAKPSPEEESAPKAAKKSQPEADDVAAPETAKPAKKAAAKPASKSRAKAAAEPDEKSAVELDEVPKPRTKAKAAVVAAPAAAPSPVVETPVGNPALTGPPFPNTDYAVVEKLLVGFLSHEIRKVGVTRAVLGLSGGVDSAVSAALAARALGPANVLGIMMPYQSSSPESLSDAYEVAKSLGIETAVVEITEQVDAYFSRFGDASLLRRGNKMARERMTILYDHSAARSALVIGTSNKTELLLGYGTLYGDMASALNPIGDLYKTQVWGLARHLALPASVIEKAPTADLWSGQTDETELGFSYHQVDRLLYRMIDERCSPAELAGMGFAPDFIERISQTIRKSQFKRRLPVIAKISARSIDTDFRYSRDWGL
jgi:NAD+ synthase